MTVENMTDFVDSTKSRENTLDMLRGMAALSVIHIHTVFGSGVGYIPEWMRQISLIFDVPVFFFLAGWTLALKKLSPRMLLGLLKLYVDYLIFSSSVVLFCLAMGANSWEDLIRVITLQGFGTESLPIAGASMWFVKVYLACMLIFYFLHAAVCRGKVVGRFFSLAAAMVVGLTLIAFRQQGYILFYLAFVSAGWLFARSGFSGRNMLSLAVLFLVMAVAYGALSPNISFQEYLMTFSKFPPDSFYLLLSLPSIGFCMWAQRFAWKNRLLEWIGRNALWVYFAQGISGSLIYAIAPQKSSDLEWVGAWVSMFLLNVILALPIAIFLRTVINPIRERILTILQESWKFFSLRFL